MPNPTGRYESFPVPGRVINESDLLAARARQVAEEERRLLAEQARLARLAREEQRLKDERAFKEAGERAVQQAVEAFQEDYQPLGGARHGSDSEISQSSAPHSDAGSDDGGRPLLVGIEYHSPPRLAWVLDRLAAPFRWFDQKISPYIKSYYLLFCILMLVGVTMLCIAFPPSNIAFFAAIHMTKITVPLYMAMGMIASRVMAYKQKKKEENREVQPGRLAQMLAKSKGPGEWMDRHPSFMLAVGVIFLAVALSFIMVPHVPLALGMTAVTWKALVALSYASYALGAMLLRYTLKDQPNRGLSSKLWYWFKIVFATCLMLPAMALTWMGSMLALGGGVAVPTTFYNAPTVASLGAAIAKGAGILLGMITAGQTFGAGLIFFGQWLRDREFKVAAAISVFIGKAMVVLSLAVIGGWVVAAFKKAGSLMMQAHGSVRQAEACHYAMGHGEYGHIPPNQTDPVGYLMGEGHAANEAGMQAMPAMVPLMKEVAGTTAGASVAGAGMGLFVKPVFRGPDVNRRSRVVETNAAGVESERSLGLD